MKTFHMRSAETLIRIKSTISLPGKNLGIAMGLVSNLKFFLMISAFSYNFRLALTAIWAAIRT